MSFVERFPPVYTEDEISNLAEAWRKHGGTTLLGGHGTEQTLTFGGSVTEAENEFHGTVPFGGHGTEQNFKFGGSVAERPSSVDTERNKL